MDVSRDKNRDTLLDPLWHRVYLYGYRRKKVSRLLRRLFARSTAHRAWFCGYTGCFTGVEGAEAGVRFGPANPYGQWRARWIAARDTWPEFDTPRACVKDATLK